MIACAGVLLLAALGSRSTRVKAARVVMTAAVALIGLAALAASVLVPHARWSGSGLLAATGLDNAAAPTAAALISWAAAAYFQQSRRARWPVVLLGTAAAGIALLAIVGHWHGFSVLHSPLGGPSMEVPTAAAIVLLSLGIVAIAPHHGPASMPRGPALFGAMPRWLLPGAVLIALLLGSLVLKSHSDLATPGFAIATVVIGAAIGIACLIALAVFDLGRIGPTQDVAYRALDSAGLGIIIADQAIASGYAPIVYTNQAFSAISGYAPDEVIGRPLHFFAIEATGDNDAIARIAVPLRDDEHRTVSFQAIRKDGSLFSCRMTLSVVPGNGRCNDHCIALLADVTAERLAAEASERAHNKMLASITHDLRSPLAASLMWTDVVELSPLSEKTAKAVEAIRRNLKFQARLVNGLIDTAKLASGDLDLFMEPGDLETLIERSMPTWRSIAEAADVGLVCTIVPGDYGVIMDVERIGTALRDLICFTVHAAPASTRVELTVSSGESFVLIQIKAPPGGLSETDIDQAFTSYWKNTDARHEGRQRPGVGLDLSVARHVASLHGGSLNTSSQEPDRGLVFRFSIPKPSSPGADQTGTRKQAVP